MTKIISNFIDYKTRNNGFLSAKKLHFEIMDIFNESICCTRIRNERKKLSISLNLY
jgi:hypothetical protein